LWKTLLKTLDKYQTVQKTKNPLTKLRILPDITELFKKRYKVLKKQKIFQKSFSHKLLTKKY